MIARTLGVEESEITFENVIYSSSTTAEISSDEAVATFQESAGEASVTSIAIAAAFIVAAAVASGCIGASIGR